MSSFCPVLEYYDDIMDDTYDYGEEFTICYRMRKTEISAVSQGDLKITIESENFEFLSPIEFTSDFKQIHRIDYINDELGTLLVDKSEMYEVSSDVNYDYSYMKKHYIFHQSKYEGERVSYKCPTTETLSITSVLTRDYNSENCNWFSFTAYRLQNILLKCLKIIVYMANYFLK